MKKKIFKYSELFILLLVFICCFIPCLRYDNNMVVDIYIFDANKIMGYSYMLILIIAIIYKIYLMRKNNNEVVNYWSLIIITISTILYVVSCILRRNMWINFSFGFYLSIGSLVLMILLHIKKIFMKDKSKKIKKN